MSTVPTVTTWSLPVPVAGLSSRTKRRLLLALAAVVLAAPLGYLAYQRLRPPTVSATAQDAELAAARARALARASAQAKARAAVVGKPSLLGQDRVADSSSAADLFARHSWYVAPPPPPPAKAEPPPPPTAPPFPYTVLGSYAPAGAQAVYFLARGDRVIDAHVGDRLDGVYEFKSAANGQLTFNYLPLNIEQALSIGASQ